MVKIVATLVAVGSTSTNAESSQTNGLPVGHPLRRLDKMVSYFPKNLH